MKTSCSSCPPARHLVENRWRDQGRAVSTRTPTGISWIWTAPAGLTVHTKSRTLSYWDPPDILRRVYTLVNSSYQERMKKRNLGHALDAGPASRLLSQCRTRICVRRSSISRAIWRCGLGRYRDGEKSLLRAMDLYPGNNDASERLCEMDMLQGDPQAALLRLAGMYADSSEFWGFSSFGVQLFKGYVFLHMGMFSKAGDEFEKIRVQPAQPGANVPGRWTTCSRATMPPPWPRRAGWKEAPGSRRPARAQAAAGPGPAAERHGLGRARFLFDDIFRNSLEFGHLAELSTWYLLAREGPDQPRRGRTRARHSRGCRPGPAATS